MPHFTLTLGCSRKTILLLRYMSRKIYDAVNVTVAAFKYVQQVDNEVFMRDLALYAFRGAFHFLAKPKLGAVTTRVGPAV